MEDSLTPGSNTKAFANSSSALIVVSGVATAAPGTVAATPSAKAIP